MKFSYAGLDLQPGPNVDYVPKNPYAWPELEDEYFDVIISGQAFEHKEFPWLIINEMKKKLKINGLICIVAPSRRPEHKYPVDCWRHYPDGFRALAKWAGLRVLEAKTCWGASGFSDGSDQRGDSFCILWKNESENSTKNTKHRSVSTRREINRNSPLESAKTASYYSFARGEIIDAVVKNGLSAKRVLEIGCAGGATGKKMKETMSVDYYVGVEICEEAAGSARQHLDRVIVADIEKSDLMDFGLKHGNFDLLLALDVLEHLYNPWDVLASLKKFLKPDGHVIASIPNIQNVTIVNSLISGRWRYESAGILDATHVRFFTMEEIEKLFSGADLSITKTEYVLNPPVDLSKIKDSGNKLSDGNISLTDLSREDVLRLFTYQYIIIAKNGQAMCVGEESTQIEGRSPAPSAQQSGAPEADRETRLQCMLEREDPIRGLVSIIILAHNQLEYTKKCLDSIFKYTNEPFQLIIVDNRSTDGTAEYLNGVREGSVKVGGWKFKIGEESNVVDCHAKAMEEIKSKGKSQGKKGRRKTGKIETRELACRSFKVIRNEENRGFALGNNQGMAEATGDYLLLMNNDVVVTHGWLGRLIACAERRSQIGIVGPMSNYVSGPQLVKEITYDTNSLAGLDQFARDYAQKHHGQAKTFWRVVGFCMLIKRAVVKKIGGFDGRYGLGNFEDDDLSLRAASAGFESWIAQDCFIHHFGNRTFIGAHIDYNESLKKNWEIFKKKWGIPSHVPYGAPYDMAKFLSHGFMPAKHYCPLKPEEFSISQGEELFNSGDVEEAKVIFEKIVHIDPKNIEALNNLGVIHFLQSEIDKARSYFISALELNPNYYEAVENLGNCMIAQKSYQEAITWFKKALDLTPDDVNLLNSIANCYIQIEDLTKAEEVYSKSYQINHNQPRVGEILEELEGLKAFETQRRINP
jgi:GT2 family glycosyltransferase/2-polyprenyl-3-methyl-5-hydroxy-6-metoxy-1,4-benzoquinol methylase